VSFIKYDQFGYKIDPNSKEDEEIQKYIAKDGDVQGFSDFIPAVGEQYEKAMEMK